MMKQNNNVQMQMADKDCQLSNDDEYVLDKLGISYIGGEVVFRAGDRVITRSSVQDLVSKIRLGELPFRLDIDNKLSQVEAFEGMKELICLSPEIGRVLIAHVFSAFIRAAFKKVKFIPSTVLIIEGESGVHKSYYVPYITQLYNRDDEIKCNTRFNSSQSYIEDIMGKHDECTVVIDDLHTAGAKSIKRMNEITAEEIIRRISDDTGRGHKEGNSAVQKRFGGNVVFIGEYNIVKDSTVPRALIVKLTKKIDRVVLDKCQRKKHLHVSTFYYYFLQWYVEYYADICVWIDEQLTKFREATAKSALHGRLLDTQFYLQTSYKIFLEFCKDSQFISEEDVLDEYDSFRKQLCKLIQEQQERFRPIKAPKEDIDYLKLIRKLYRKDKFRLADSAADFQEDKHDGLIYYECLCLRRDKLEKKLHKISTDIKINDVINELVAKKALKLANDKKTVKISTLNKGVGSLRFYAIWLHEIEK